VGVLGWGLTLVLLANPVVALESQAEQNQEQRWIVTARQQAPFAPLDQVQRSLALDLPSKKISQASYLVEGSPEEIALLRGSQSILAIESETLLYTQISNDPFFSDQWHFEDPLKTPGSLGGAEYLDLGTGRGTVVAVIDTGYTPHPDLVQNLLPGYDFVSLPSIANDGDGWDADASDPGDWVSQSEANGSLSGCEVSDSSWHGTHVMGIIAAASNNGIGVSGVAPEAKILPIRVIGKCGARESDMIAGLTWATGGQIPGVPNNPNPAAVVNLSLGSDSACSFAMQEAVNSAIARGAVVIAAAGNSSSNLNGSMPAGCTGVIAVTSLGKTGSLASYSNFGSKSDGRVIAAPGGDRDGKILSTANSGKTGPTQPNYLSYAGTSMAAPMVAGIAAVLKQMDPSLTGNNFANSVMTLAVGFRNPSCNNSRCGTGQVSSAGLVGRAFASTPIASVAISGSKVRLNWDSNRSAFSNYVFEFQYRPKGTQEWLPLGRSTFGLGVFEANLPEGQTFEIRYSLTSPQSRSPWQTVPNSLTTAAPIQAAQRLSVTGNDREIRGEWDYPQDDRSSSFLVGFIFKAVSLRTGDSFSCSTKEFSCVIKGLTNGAAYKTSVTSVGVGGNRATLEGKTIAPIGLPGVPLAPIVVMGDSKVLVAWGKPVSDGGGRVKGYSARFISRNSQESNCSTQTALFCITELKETFPYTITVRSINDAGLSVPSKALEAGRNSRPDLGQTRVTKKVILGGRTELSFNFTPRSNLRFLTFEARLVGKNRTSEWKTVSISKLNSLALSQASALRLELRVSEADFKSLPQVHSLR
jgi:hypothetical protein